ncbi:MAG: hypothetical protein KGS09_18910 [Nitrospirae bacterium]|nr:hypothetical protein [Nitrospirota bacterium]MDE3041574.1 hypothetical protein [Nitrospirota bacterium]MDE3051947.1 hypothetical protein [Nitrospirota bacterium]MDE3219714.1 hypothetical protein [Nitrospirota bacterium]
MAYLENAPKALIDLYEKRLRTDGSLIDGLFVPLIKYCPPRKNQAPLDPLQVLEELLCNSRMKPAWNIINKSVKSEDDYKKLFKAIIESMRLARRGIVSQMRREKYEDIAKRAEKLAKVIAEPRYVPGANLLYTGDLDLQAFELLSEDVASNLGAESYSKMKSAERSDWAYRLLPEWPTMVGLLKELAVRARQCGSEKQSLADRDRGRARVVIFVRELYMHFHSMNAQFNGFSAIATIASIAMGVKNLTGKTVGKIIFGATGKLPIKGREKSVLNG